MQILIDSATETPASLRHAALLVNYWAALTEGRETSINGDGGEITLTTTETHTIGDISHTVTHAAAKRPAAPPVGPAPTPGPVVPLPPGNLPVQPVVHPERHPDAPVPEPPAAPQDNLDPKVVFGKFGAGSVPAGTTAAPSLPAAPSTATVPGSVTSAAPAAGNAPPAPNTAGAGTASNESVQLDKAGIPWDARVHSDTRKMNADGTWRFRRNLETVTRDAVMAELRAAAQVSLPPVAPGPTPGQPANGVTGQLPLSPEAPPVPQQPVATNSVPTAPDAPNPPVTLPATSLPVQSSANVGVPDAPNTGVVPPPVTSFRELMTKINVARAKGQLSQEQVDAACLEAKVESVTALAAQPILVPAVDRVLNRFLVGVAA